ncbi:MAG: hypothetical protein WBP11_10595 [Dokdonella sp.]
MCAITLLIGLLTSTAAMADESFLPAARFSAVAKLIAPPQQSADLRYSIKAELKANTAQQTGRFALTAKRVTAAKTSEGDCGPLSDLLFANGFDN